MLMAGTIKLDRYRRTARLLKGTRLPGSDAEGRGTPACNSVAAATWPVWARITGRDKIPPSPSRYRMPERHAATSSAG